MSIIVCRRCHRPLTSPLAVAAGVGGRCALLDLIEAAQRPVAPTAVSVGATSARTAIALVAAFLHHQDEQIGPLLHETDVRDVAGLLAAVTAQYLQDQPDGAQRLRLAGLRVAQVTG